MKNLKDVIDKKYKEGEFSRETIETVLKFYWKEGVYDSLKSLEHESVYIKNIGTFITTNKKIKTDILRCIKQIRIINNKEKKTQSLSDKKYKTKNRIRKLLVLRNIIATRNYNKFKNKQT